MARIHGRRGALYVDVTAGGGGGTVPVSYLSKWDANFTVDKVEVTAFGDTNKTYVPGLPDAQGTFSGFFDNASAQLYTAARDGAARNFYLYPDNTVSTTGPYWFGQAIFDFAVQGDVGAAVTVSGSWAATSNITKQG